VQIKSFQYFITIADMPTLSAAAEALFVSQPALSQQLKKIEEEIGAQLFCRVGHTMRITPAGEVFLQYSRRILQIYDGMKKEIQVTQSTEQKAVRFGISPFYSQHYLPRLLPPFLAQNPEIKIDIVEDISHRLEQQLIDGDLDFCALPLFPQNELLEYETIYLEEILMAIPKNHPINAHYPDTSANGERFPYIDLSLLKNEAFIGLKKIQKFSQMGLRLCKEAGFVPNTVCETLNWETVHMLVATGLGVGFIPKMLVGTITDPELRPRYYQLPSNFYRAYAIARRPGTVFSGHARILIDSFRESFKNM